MKKLLGIVVLGFLISNNAYSKVYTWTCLMMPSKDFQMIFQINDARKTIKHLSSYDFNTKKKYDVNKYHNVLKFEKDFAWSTYFTNNENAGLRYNDFKNNRIMQSTILPSNLKDYIYQDIEYDCFVSN